jgi:hypothetical protein
MCVLLPPGYLTSLKNLLAEVVTVAPGTRAGREVPSALPAGPLKPEDGNATSDPVTFHVNIWHLPLQQAGYIRGATNAKHVLENMSTFMLLGNKSATYPLEVAPMLLHLADGSPLTDCCLGVSVGNAVAMASHLFLHGVVKHNLWQMCPEEQKRAFAVRLRQCLVLTVMWKYHEDLKSAIFDSISTKQAVGRRARTSVLGYVSAYSVLVDQDLQKRGQRKSRAELMGEHIKWHNKSEKARGCRLQGSEIKAIMTLMQWPQQSQGFRMISAIWGASHPSQASVTTDMIAADYLDPSKESMLVSKDQNPLWHMIFTPTMEITETFLARAEGVFQRNIDAVVKAGKKPSLANRADCTDCLVWEVLNSWVTTATRQAGMLS